MQKVTTVNLNGVAYQLEDSGYEALCAYLERAAATLRDNPDKAEIVADLEQAIAEKCRRYLSSHKNVLAGAEIDQILSEMGPVEAPGAAAPGAASAPPPAGEPAGAAPAAQAQTGAPRRLYQIHEGAMISGVCAGLAAYFGIDVTVVRLIFVALAAISFGGFIVAYLIMMCVIPYADTSEERAAAHGQPFNARELIEQAHKHYQQFGRPAWRRWREEQRARRREWRHARRHRWHHWAPPAGYTPPIAMGVLAPIFAVLNAAALVLFVLALLSLVRSGAVFGWPLPGGIPIWIGIILLVVIYNVIAQPLRAGRRSAYFAYGPSFGWLAALDASITVAIVVALIWFATHHGAQIHQFGERMREFWMQFIHGQSI